MNPRIRCFWVLLLLLGQAFATAGSPQFENRQSDRVLQDQYVGTLGHSRIGMTLVRRGEQIESDHYFYQNYLKDIPLTGAEEESTVVLNERGGTFRLHFVGNGSEGGQPLNFSNSIGMEGTWTSADGQRIFPVSLRGDSILYGADTGRRYADVTVETDEVFEQRVQAFLRAVIKGDHTTAARYVSYPLFVRFPDGSKKNLRTPAEILAAWDSIFTKAMLATLSASLPHDMFVRDGMAMLGNGEAWFDRKGAKTLNVTEHLP